MANSSDDRSPMAVAVQWSSRIMTVSLEMVVPGLAGLWIDRRLETTPLVTLVGFAVGLTMGIWHLIRLTRSQNKVSSRQAHEERKPDR